MRDAQMRFFESFGRYCGLGAKKKDRWSRLDACCRGGVSPVLLSGSGGKPDADRASPGERKRFMVRVSDVKTLGPEQRFYNLSTTRS